MKNYFSLLFLLTVFSSIGQTMDNIVFDYDAAGNQIKRYLIDTNGDRQSSKPVKDANDIVESDFIKADIYDDIKYYPNPVKEELYLSWQLVNDTKVLSMQLYTLNGQFIQKFDKLESTNTYAISFRDLPQAIYSLVLNYSNGEQKSLKIIKH
ncbi:T9SS type A sorting domain-containing protein [Flavobacterium silvisoli]|uniref:T9SS type A sorting domain-containing protein n=1 Tax=Flavobacterium silvisoli TaxID=2529433 RepID=A0A4Q9YXI3_9FLAO|nr:T9SS type A sorting domain-containing protein [Flavobacterium silvisoli]TBX68332.1 T9SS type A sorting domain-containing protein [Flavobacterium silvisoli]